MRPALAPQFELPCLFGIEKDNRLDAHATVLSAAKAYDIYARFPRHLRRSAIERDQSIGKARAVEVHGEAKGLGHFREGVQLFECMDAAPLGHLRDRNRPTLWSVYATAFFESDAFAQGLRCHLVGAGHQRQLGATGVEFRRIALVLVNVRHGRAKDGLPWLAITTQCQRIRRRAGGHEIDRSLGCLEDITNETAHVFHDRVGTIGHRIMSIGRKNVFHDLRVRGAGIVGGQKHQEGSSMIWSSHSSSGVSNSLTVIPLTEMPASCTDCCVPVISGCHSGNGFPSQSKWYAQVCGSQ